jgi:pentapeptide MXKDX repeat protein
MPPPRGGALPKAPIYQGLIGAIPTLPSGRNFSSKDMEPITFDFILLGRLFQQEIKMRNLLIAACCVAFVGSVSVASAQTTNPPGQDSMKTNSPMDPSAKKKKKTKKGAMKSDDSMSKGDMSKDGMKKDSTSK